MDAPIEGSKPKKTTTKPSKETSDDDNDDDEEEDDPESSRPGGEEDDDLRPSSKRVGSALVVDLGKVSAGDEIELDVPENALGINITVASQVATTEEIGLGIDAVTSPSGEALVKGFTPRAGTIPNGEAWSGMASVSIPQDNQPSSAPVAGKWKIKFGASEGTNPSAGHARARIQMTSDGKFQGGALDLHVHLAQGLQISQPNARHVVSASTAPTDPAMTERIDIFFQAMKSSFGIDRGKVSFHDAPSSFININDDLTTLRAFAQSKGFEEEQALHLLLSNDLWNQSLLGLAPGIPGAASITGTTMSGVLAAIYVDEVDPATDGYTWLHEMGHFIGLQHTTEADGKIFDLLSDTAQCPGTRTPSCGDEGNLMTTGQWPANSALPNVSGGQKLVFQASPIYRAGGGGAGLKGKTRSSSAIAAEHSWHLTKSGRALDDVERWIASSFCGSGPHRHGTVANLDVRPDTLIRSRGRSQAITDLDRISRDPDLPRIFRTKATKILTSL